LYTICIPNSSLSPKSPLRLLTCSRLCHLPISQTPTPQLSYFHGYEIASPADPVPSPLSACRYENRICFPEKVSSHRYGPASKTQATSKTIPRKQGGGHESGKGRTFLPPRPSDYFCGFPLDSSSLFCASSWSSFASIRRCLSSRSCRNTAVFSGDGVAASFSSRFSSAALRSSWK